MAEEPRTKSEINVISTLVAIIYGLGGLIGALASHNFKVLFEDLYKGKPLPFLTEMVLVIPISAWIIGSILIGGVASFLIERIYRSSGQVPRWITLGMVSVALLILTAVMIVAGWPLFEGPEGLPHL